MRPNRSRRHKEEAAGAFALKPLLDNAFDFLQGALRQLDRDPKRSTIEFYTAVELFLKARLLAEHWSLIVAKDPDRDQFQRGDFMSVSFDESHRRLRRIIGQPLAPEAIAAFDKVRTHRNRMVHFFQSDDTQQTTQSIAFEQLAAWHQLNRLILGPWADFFPSDTVSRVAAIEHELTRHHAYAEERFKYLLPQIKQDSAAGAIFVRCSSCMMNAAERDTSPDWIHGYKCRVCMNSWSEIPLACPQCGAAGVIQPYQGFRCRNRKCGHALGANEIYGLLDDDQTPPDEFFDRDTPANCDECQSYETVCRHGGEYVCVNCLSVFDRVYACEWCGAFGTERRENSGWTGCEFCEGRAGHIRDE